MTFMHGWGKRNSRFIAALAAVAVIALLAGAGWRWRWSAAPAEIVAVSRGAVTQEVIVTGTVKPVQSVAAAFMVSGRIAEVKTAVGDRVAAGTPLVVLEAADAAAQVEQAEASAAAESARLEELRRGQRPEEIRIAELNLEKTRQELTGTYALIRPALMDGYAKSDDALRRRLDPLFNNDEELNPFLTFATKNSQVKIDVETLRLAAGYELRHWQNELELPAAAVTDRSVLDQTIEQAMGHLLLIERFLNRLMTAVVEATDIPRSTVDLYQTAVTEAKAAVNGALTALTNQRQAAAIQRLIILRVENELTLQRAGSDPQEIAVQQARLKEAEARLRAARIQLAERTLRSPLTGIVVRQEAEVGQLTAAQAPLVTVAAEKDPYLEINVPEADIGKLRLGNRASITLDAFPDERWDGRVTAIDPAATTIDGVVNYRLRLSPDRQGSRFRDGLTANVVIQTLRKINVLVLSQTALLENDRGAFVKVWNGAAMKETPVKVGLRGAGGLREIIAGLREGERVVNIGVKRQP